MCQTLQATMSMFLAFSITIIAFLLTPAVSLVPRPFTSAAIATACKATMYPTLCTSTFTTISKARPMKSPVDIFDVSVELAMIQTQSTRSLAYNLTFSDEHTMVGSPTGMHDCLELLDDTFEHLRNVLDNDSTPDDVETWLSAALTNQMTCSESLKTGPPANKTMIEARAESLTRFISNSLALHKNMKYGNERLMREMSSDGFPRWVSDGDRKLLQASAEEIEPDAVVAMDGSGTHRSINEAIAFVWLAKGGRRGDDRTVIHVKRGTYHEYIRIPTKHKNVMLMGDGKGKSKIIGNRNNKDGWTTYQSATVAGMGAGFIAKDLTIINNAGASKEQAVALRVGADRAVIFRCSIEGYQDTLYTHSNRQFYRDNDITGTVDFIFGNSAAVFQNCNISPRRPRPGQKNSITAQGRHNPNQNTGISIQSCRITATSDLATVRGRVPTYLGRPWQKFSRVVVMESFLDDSVHPAGWEPWSGGFALSTLYYGEYRNTGPGASTSGRVRWRGVHSALSEDQASKFTVTKFISGDAWLPGTGVNYTTGL